jgi:hypothetical protein
MSIGATLRLARFRVPLCNFLACKDLHRGGLSKVADWSKVRKRVAHSRRLRNVAGKTIPTLEGEPMTRRILLTGLLSLAFVSTLGTTLWADHRRDPHDEIRHHAADLSDHCRELYDEIRLHFRGHPLAAHLLSDTLNVQRSARRMMSYADVHASRSTLEREVTRLENAFHHLEDTLRGVSHHHGSHRHVRELMRSVDVLVHEIHDDIHQLGGRRFDSRNSAGGLDLGPSDWYLGSGGFTLRLGR